ncbi:hypothetical protein SAMN05421678_1308 [Actinopolymorpha cephalotaxi]|uniref:Multidrug transporter EmrE-like cation transporter n=1 Tax=Actinopolymorpha cephalotaxi TaxID=504797 RepID=A0A1I3C780_9ACTN|nr:hypothetical protein [Actinopolymorpha cephalotaxi]NYH86829.1 multidrug transporter EmrE-like cation transporter [Actinopolymorpha cephalotaxi]SFH70253.1 hypothetical protein SAMN05421678_1308 [Actinopolymorpha cephalotaxi]
MSFALAATATTAATSTSSRPQRLLHRLTAASVVGGPLCFWLGGLLAPPSMHTDGGQTVAANLAADPATNTAHLIAFFAASFLLPVSIVGLARLSWARTPWLSALGGLAGVVGWIPLSALTALDAAAVAMARMPGSSSYGRLYDAFAYGPLMNAYLIVYIVGHLAAYVLLGIALRRARVVPAWAAWAMVASSPLTMAMFVLPGNPVAVGAVAIGLLVAGSVPAARALWTTS